MPGKGPTPTEISTSSISPSQNSGIAYSATPAVLEIRSNGCRGRHAPRMPIRIPTIEASTVAVPTSSTVGHNRSPITSKTGWRNLSDDEHVG